MGPAMKQAVSSTPRTAAFISSRKPQYCAFRSTKGTRILMSITKCLSLLESSLSRQARRAAHKLRTAFTAVTAIADCGRSRERKLRCAFADPTYLARGIAHHQGILRYIA